MTNVLFVCSANRLRSPTAEQVFSTWPGIETDSAGISNDADVLLSTEQVEWADIIFVMEKAHRTKLNRKFRASLNGKRVICLDIPDDYEFMDPVLVRMLESRAGRFLSRPAPTRPTRVEGFASERDIVVHVVVAATTAGSHGAARCAADRT